MPSILNIGQCDVDGPRMTELFRRELRANVLRADNVGEAEQILQDQPVDLVLVNRELAFDDEPGIEVIDDLRRAGCAAPIMLVSDYEEAQEEALQHGAIRGFGKSQLQDPATIQMLRDVIEPD